jgi:tRNA G10  N-methylase Trm11
MSSYWFITGHEPKLSLAELFGLFPTATFAPLANAVFSSAQACEPKKLITELGGTVKIAQEIARDLTREELVGTIFERLLVQDSKIIFGLSSYPGEKLTLSGKLLEDFGKEIKKKLKAEGRSVRYVDNRGKLDLSSVSVEKNGLLSRGAEFVILPTGTTFSLAQTRAVQPFEALSTRDFGRPGRDDVSGMLPPKLAMMMINCLGLPKTAVLYDPSCGSGTTLMEATLLGYTKLFGSDISTKAIADTNTNNAWLHTHIAPHTSATITVFEHDIRSVPKTIPVHSVDGVMTEPFLGPPLKGLETLETLKKNTAELVGLYQKTFASLTEVLKPGARVVFILPRFRAGKDSVRTAEKTVPAIASLGFKPQPLLPVEMHREPYVLYDRPGQHVGREIWKFIYKG